MAKEGKKLELYEILAAKRAKGKAPLGLDAKAAKQANQADPVEPPPYQDKAGPVAGPAVIIDEALSESEVAEHFTPQPLEPAEEAEPVAAPVPMREKFLSRSRERKAPVKPVVEEEPPPEPRPRSPREVVFALDTAFIFFIVVLALVGSSYFLGYKRGQEERPAGLAGVADIELSDPNHINLRTLPPAPRSTLRPPEQDYTLIIRKEPVGDDLLERLEMELAEALAKGRQEFGADIPGFIYNTGGSSPLYVLAVGVGKSNNDPSLTKLMNIYNNMSGVTLSRLPQPYKGCGIGQIRDLGTQVY